MQGKGFNSFASNMTKLSVNETKWSCLLARPALLFFIFRFENLISGPKRYRGFRETGPWSLRDVPTIFFGVWFGEGEKRIGPNCSKGG